MFPDSPLTGGTGTHGGQSEQVRKGEKNEIFKEIANAQKICCYVSKLAVEAQLRAIVAAR